MIYIVLRLQVNQNKIEFIGYKLRPLKGKHMKKIAIITKNRILAESLSIAIEINPDLKCEFFLFLNYPQALLDAEIFEIDVALIDVVGCNLKHKEVPLLFWDKMHKTLPNCHLLLLVSQEDLCCREIANQAKEMKIIEDFVFYDASLKYLLAKLASI